MRHPWKWRHESSRLRSSGKCTSSSRWKPCANSSFVSRVPAVGIGSGSKEMCSAPAMERRQFVPIDRVSRACRGVRPGLTEWYSAAESMMATRPSSQLREDTGERNHMSAG